MFLPKDASSALRQRKPRLVDICGLRFLLAFTFVACSFAASSFAQVFPLKADPGGRYLMDQTGKPFLIVGEDNWSMIAQLSYAGASAYMTDFASRGGSAVLTNLLEAYYADNAPKTINKVAPFKGPYPTSPNDAYFAFADSILGKAESLGIVIMLDPTYIGQGSQGWHDAMLAASVADMQAFGSYVGNRFKTRKNIIWVMGGDTDPYDVRDKVDSFVVGLKLSDTLYPRLFTAHEGRSNISSNYWPESWLNLNASYTNFSNVVSLADSAYSFSPTMPFIQLDQQYDNNGEGATQQSLRAQDYWTVLRGGCGSFYSNCPLWHSGSSTYTLCSFTDWTTSWSMPSALQHGYFASLFTSRHWWNLTPDNGTVLTAGAKSGTDLATLAAASDGSCVIAYLPSSRSVTVNPVNLTTPQMHVQWYDPSAGTYAEVGTFATGKGSYTPPAAGDWVLVIDAVGTTSAPPAPILSTPTDGATGISVSPTLSWAPATGAATYRIQVSVDPAFGTTVTDQSGIAATSLALTGLSNNTVYYWRVNATNAGGTSTYSTVWSFTTVSGVSIPSTPVLSSPANGSTSVSVAPTLSWAASTGAVSYRVQVSTDSAFGTTVTDQSGISVTTLALSGLANNTVYYWRVNATNTGGTSAYSTVWSFTTIVAVPSAPVLSTPANSATGIAINPTLTWNSSTGATSYRVQVSVDPAFGSTFADQSGLSVTTLALSGLANNTVYYWRVNATNAGGTSSYSTIWSFTTIPLSSGGSVVSFHTMGSSTASRLVTYGYTYMSYSVCDSAGYLDSLMVPMHNNWDGDDTVYGLIYSGNSGDIQNFIGRSRDSVVVNTSNLTSYVFHFNPGAVSVSAATVYYIGVHSMTSKGYTKVGATSNNTSRTGYDADVAPPDSPWNLSEYTNQNQIAMTAYYHTGSTNPVTPPSAPSLSSPSNGTTAVATAPTLSWTASTGATSYRVQVSTSSQFTSTVADQSGISGTSLALTGLANNTVYYWRVNATNTGGTSSYSTFWSFTTILAAPSAPLLSTPANSATGIAVNPTLTWNASTGGTSYRVQVSVDPAFGTSVTDQSEVTATSLALTGLANNTVYYWRVNATNAGGTSAYSTIWSFTTIVAAPLAPLLSTPSNSATGIAVNPTLSWNASTGATSYRVQVSVDPAFGTTVSDQSGIASTSLPLTGLANNTVYYWRVNATNTGGTSAYSTIWSFTTVTGVSIPSAPVLSSPANGSTSVRVAPTLSWAASTGAVSYRVQVSTDSAFGTTVTDQSGISVTTLALSGLANNTVYYWRVNATNTGGTSAYSTVWSFTTIVAVPSAPVLSTPANSATGIAINPTLTWNSSTGATSYRVQVSVDPAFGSTFADQSGLSVTTIALSGLSNNTVYYWRVNATNAGGTSSYSTIWSFTTIPLSSGGSVVSFHTLGSSTASRLVTYGYTYMSYSVCDSAGYLDSLMVPMHNNWDGDDTVYGLIYSGNSGDIQNFIGRSRDSVVVNTSNLTSYVFHFNPGAVSVSAATVYYIGVHSMTSKGYTKVGATSNNTSRTGYDADAAPPDSPWNLSEYTNQNQIAMTAYYHTGSTNPVTPPSAPSLSSPANGTTAVAITPTLSWTASTGATSYRVQVSTDPTFGTTFADQSGVTATSLSISGLGYSTVYYWRANATNAGGTSAYSTVWSFTTRNRRGTAKANADSVGNVNVLPSSFSLAQNYPNPFNPTTRIEFSLAEEGSVRLEVYDLLGRKVRTLLDGEFSAGSHVVQWNSTGDGGRSVGSGIYFYRLQAGDMVETKKMILLK